MEQVPHWLMAAVAAAGMTAYAEDVDRTPANHGMAAIDLATLVEQPGNVR
jgi:hypothetical protein